MPKARAASIANSGGSSTASSISGSSFPWWPKFTLLRIANMFDKVLTIFVLSCATSSALAAEAVTTPPAPAWRLTKTIALGAPDRWDALTFDPASGRVYIAHGDRVTVVDGKSGAI